jgi:mutator family transposase
LRFIVDRPVPGGNRRRRVDILLRGARIPVFVDGCVWHSCSEHSHLPKANTSWWRLKFRGVACRDRDTDTQLAGAGWLAVRIWEHEDPVAAAQTIEQLVRDRTAEKQPRHGQWRPAEWCAAGPVGRGVDAEGGHRVILRTEFPPKLEEIHAMTAPSSIDPARFLHEQLGSASPDLLRSMLTTFMNTLMSAEADAICGAPYGESSPERTNVRKRLPPPRLRHPRRHHRRRDPQAA